MLDVVWFHKDLIGLEPKFAGCFLSHGGFSCNLWKSIIKIIIKRITLCDHELMNYKFIGNSLVLWIIERDIP